MLKLDGRIARKYWKSPFSTIIFPAARTAREASKVLPLTRFILTPSSSKKPFRLAMDVGEPQVDPE
ncbi:MAG: hypothetical protein LBG26_02575 [Treponema sp.]|nr:hypothetical protein [Treponema sp.]